MNDLALKVLIRNKQLIPSLLDGLSPELHEWSPVPGKWNLTYIMAHLYDEERLDFKARIKHLFKGEKTPFSAIDPEAWEVKHNYHQLKFENVLQSWVAERHQSIQWLKENADQDWNSYQDHQHFGKMSATMLLANWVAHDLLHIRQIQNNIYQWFKYKTGENFDYAAGL